MAPSYAAVLRAPHARRTFAAALLGRLSYGTVGLSLTLAVTASTGSYAAAGTVIALFGLSAALLSPPRAALIDRLGPRRALPPMTAAYALTLAALTAATWRPGTPAGPVAALATAAGVTSPPLGPVTRTLWKTLVPDGPLLARAYSLDTVAEELLYVTGPLLAGALAAAANPALGIALSAVLVVTGTLGMITSPAVRAAPPPPAAARTGPVLPLIPVIAAAATGTALGALTLLGVAFTARHHAPAAVAWVEAALAAGSAAGGLAHGAVAWRGSARTRLAVLVCGGAAVIAPAGLAPGPAALAVLACAAGLFVSPALTTAYLLADEAAAPGARTRAGAWVNTAVNLGASTGTAGAGLLLDAVPLPVCFALAAAPAVPAAAVLLAPLAGPATKLATGCPPRPPSRTDGHAPFTEETR